VRSADLAAVALAVAGSDVDLAVIGRPFAVVELPQGR